MIYERLSLSAKRTLVPAAACIALLGMGIKGDHVKAITESCELSVSASADAAYLPAELHDGLKQAVDIYNMVDPEPLTQQAPNRYHKALHFQLPNSATQLVLDITARDKFPTMDGGDPFPDNVTNITTQVVNSKTHIPYAKQAAEKQGSAWKLSGSYLTEVSDFEDSYQMTSVITSGGIHACASQTEYAVQSGGRHAAMSTTKVETRQSPEVATESSRMIVGQLAVLAGGQQHFNPGILTYTFPTRNADFLHNFGIVAPVKILQPPESQL